MECPYDFIAMNDSAWTYWVQIIAKQTSHKSMDQVADLESFRISNINLTHLYFNQDMCYSITITYLVCSIDIKKV